MTRVPLVTEEAPLSPLRDLSTSIVDFFVLLYFLSYPPPFQYLIGFGGALFERVPGDLLRVVQQ